MRWGETPSFLSTTGPALLVSSRDEDAITQVVSSEPQKKPPITCKPATSEPSRYTRKPANRCTKSTTPALPDTLTPPGAGAFVKPILVCAGTGVASSSNNDSEQSSNNLATMFSKPHTAVTLGSTDIMRQRNNSHTATPTLTRSDSELEGIIQELRDHIFKHNQAGKQPDAASARNGDNAVHHRRHLKNPLEKMLQAGTGERPRTNARPRPTSSLSKRVRPSTATSSLKTESALPALITGTFPSVPNQPSQVVSVTLPSSTEKGEWESTVKSVEEPELHEIQDNERGHCHLIEGATLNPRPTRKPPVPIFSTLMRQPASTTTAAASESELSRPRRERMRAHNYALAVECTSDDSDNSTDTDGGSPVGPWTTGNGFSSFRSKQIAGSPSSSSLSPMLSLSFYDEEVANRSPRSRLLWLSDFGVDDEYRESYSTSALLRLKWEHETATDCPSKSLTRAASCTNTRQKTRALDCKLKRCSSANPSKRANAGKSRRGSHDRGIGKVDATSNN